MSPSSTVQAQAAEALTPETRTFTRQVRTETRRKYAPEDKARIVLEGSHREVTVGGLCRREETKPGVFYAWTRECMEAGKERLTRDTVRDATRDEIEHLKRENHGLKQLAADLSLEVHRLKTRPPRLWTMAPAHERPGEAGRHTPGGTRPGGENGGCPPNCRCPGAPIPGGGPVNCKGSKPGHSGITRAPWNRLSSPGEAAVLAAARESPEWSSRPPAAWVTDHLRLSVGESTVQRILKREGLVRPPEIQLAAGKEYQRKTTGPHQMWAAGAAYFRVVAAW